MAVVTVRPNATVQVPAGWTVVVAANAHTALNDELDTTYLDSPITANSTVTGVIVDLGTTTIPSTARVKGVRMSMRSRDDMSFPPLSCVLAARPYLNSAVGAGVQSTPGNTSITSYDGGYETSKPAGGPWLQADIDALQVLLTSQDQYYGFGQGGKIYRLAVDIEYNQLPTVTPSANVVGGEAFATTTWVYADTEGDPQEAYRYAIFTAAQYGIGGFDPATSPATYRGDWVLSSTARSLVTPTLANATYRVYMQVRQPTLSGQEMASAWAFSGFTVSVTPPTAPTLSAATGQATLGGRVALTYTINNSHSGTKLVVEYSDDAGAVWDVHPEGNAIAVAAPSSGTFYDYEAPHGVARLYRLKVQTAALVSAYSSTQSGTDPTQTWSLKDLTDSSRNLVGAQISAFRFRPHQPRALYNPLGRPDSIAITDAFRGISGTFDIRTQDKATYDAAWLLLTSGRTLFLQDPFGRQWHISVASDSEWTTIRAADPLGTYPTKHLHEATYGFDEVARPSVL